MPPTWPHAVPTDHGPCHHQEVLFDNLIRSLPPATTDNKKLNIVTASEGLSPCPSLSHILIHAKINLKIREVASAIYGAFPSFSLLSSPQPQHIFRTLMGGRRCLIHGTTCEVIKAHFLLVSGDEDVLNDAVGASA